LHGWNISTVCEPAFASDVPREVYPARLSTKTIDRRLKSSGLHATLERRWGPSPQAQDDTLNSMGTATMEPR